MFQIFKGLFSVNNEPVSEINPPKNTGISTSDESTGDVPNDVLNFAKDWGSQLYHKVLESGEEAYHIISDKTRLKEVGGAVRGIVDKVPIFRDFQRLQDDFATEQISKRGGQSDIEAVLLPWHPEAAGVTDATVLDKLRSRVLELSKHPNTFLVSPPAEANVDDEVFRSPDNVHLANALLENDPNLAEMRYKLVPIRIREDVFWRNYFYRLSVVRQSFQLSAMADSGSDEFVCVDQDPSWYHSSSDSTSAESSTQPVKPTTTHVRKQRPSKRTTKRQVADHSKVLSEPSVTSASCLTPEETSTAAKPVPSTRNTTTASPESTNTITAITLKHKEITSEIEELIADELLEAELASDLSAFDLAQSDVEQLDRELELEILAEVDSQTNVKQSE